MEKPRSESFEVRSRQDTDSLGLLRSTYGLGAGWGSVRASSLIPTLVGNVGIPGMLLLSWLAVCVTLRVGRARRQQLTPQRRFVLDASSGSLLGTLLAAIIAVPDLEPLSFYVLLAALIACLAGIAREHRAARRPFYPGRLTSNPVPTPPRPVGGR